MTKREPNARGTGEQLRQQLVAAASELLLSPQSVALPSLRAVARACSVSPAAVYLHFESQQALLTAVIESQLLDLGAAIRSAPQHELGPIVAFGLAYAGWGLEHPGAYQLLFESADRLDLPGHEHHDAGDALIAEGSALIAAAVPGADAPRLAMSVWAALHGIVSLRLHKPDMHWHTDLETEIAWTVARLL